MNPINQVEVLVSITLASFEEQVGTIILLGQHGYRAQLIYRLTSLASSLLKTIETMEREFVETIEEGAEKMLSDSATTLEVLVQAKKADVPIPGELMQIVKRGHRSFTARLAEKEDEETSAASKRFSVMKKKIDSFLEKVGNL
jgi:hypothetical protein